MSGYHHYDETFDSHFNTDFNILSPQQQEKQQHRTEGPEQQLHTHEPNPGMNAKPITLAHDSSIQGNSQHTNSLISDMAFEDNIRNSEPTTSTNQGDAEDKKNSKPKRTRATGEALDILKKEFDMNPNPTSQRRKKLSELTGLPEKNVRIWFQNRRAKLRKGDRRGLREESGGIDSSAISGLLPYDNSSECTTFFDRIPLNINNNYYFIDICSITVGSWNRMKSGALRKDNLITIKDLSNLSPISINEIMSNATDLMVLISKKNFEINYFFSAMANNTKILFRIFFPINSVLNCSLTLETDDIIDSGTQPDVNEDEDTNENPITNDDNCDEISNRFGELKLTVSRPPNFAVYFLDASDDGSNNQWSICEDFSEGRQVNDAFVGGSNIPHALKGSQNSLKFMNSLILDYNSTNQIIPPPPSITTQPPAIMGPEPLSLHQQGSHTFFDHYDAANDMLNLQRDPSTTNETAGRDNNHHEQANSDLLSLPHESQLPNIPDFFKNPPELADDNRWL